jgi:hypothetical protein
VQGSGVQENQQISNRRAPKWDQEGLKKGMRQSVEIQVTHMRPDLQFATAEVTKSSAEGLSSASDGPSAASSDEEKQSA